MAGHLLIFILCLALLAVASAGQAAFGYLNATRYRSLMQHGATRSQAVQQITHQPGPLLASISLLYLLAVATATIVTVDFAWSQLPDPLIRCVALAVAGLLLL